MNYCFSINFFYPVFSLFIWGFSASHIFCLSLQLDPFTPQTCQLLSVLLPFNFLSPRWGAFIHMSHHSLFFLPCSVYLQVKMKVRNLSAWVSMLLYHCHNGGDGGDKWVVKFSIQVVRQQRVKVKMCETPMLQHCDCLRLYTLVHAVYCCM